MRRALHHPAVARVLRPMALVVTDRRWAAPLSALALGFGIFVGVAIGPGAAGTFATGAQVVEVPETSTEGEASEGESSAPVAPESFGGGSGGGELETESFPEAGFGGGAEESAAPQSGGGSKKSENKVPAGEEEEPEAPKAEGIVVHVNPAAGSFTVAEKGGVLNTIHAAELPAAGSELSVETRTLANGTLAEEAKPTLEAKGKRQAIVAGVVTFIDPDPASPAYSVSARGVSVLIDVHPAPAGATPPLPVLGANAEAKVEIEPASAAAAAPPAPTVATIPPQGTSCLVDLSNAPPAPPAPRAHLWQAHYKAESTPFTYSDIEGIVEAVCPATHQLLVSADDLRAAGADLTLTVPGSIDTTGLKVGDSVATTAEIAADGTMTMSGLASDERSKGADDAAAAQGDLKP